MKTRAYIIIILALFAGGVVQAQKGAGRQHPGMRMQQGIHQQSKPGEYLNLTEDQQKQMQQLREAHQKEAKPLFNQLRENRAHYKTLLSADKPDMKAIDKSIDEFTSLQNKIQKSGVQFRMDVRNILTDEQKQKIEDKKFRFNRAQKRGGGFYGHGRGMKGHHGQMHRRSCPMTGV